MGAKARIAACLLAAALMTAGTAQGALGSVISSFRLSYISTIRADGVFRDGTYVYGILDSAGTDYLRRYTPTGSIVGSYELSGTDSPCDADHSMMGSGYIDIFDSGSKKLLTYSTTGEFIKSKAVPSDTTAYAFIPDGSKYYLARGTQVFRYTLNDVLVNQFYVGGTVGGLAASPAYNNISGEYIIVGRSGTGGFTYVYSGTGSLVGSFYVTGSGTYGSVVAEGYRRADFVRAYWCNQTVNSQRWAFQVDIAATGIGVEPTSLGQVKALYR